MTWVAGTQCVARGDNRKAKPGELVYCKGDILTIVDTSTVIITFYRCCTSIEFTVGFLLANFGLLKRKGYYKARHNTTGEEGLINSSNVRERQALRIDPSLSLMP